MSIEKQFDATMVNLYVRAKVEVNDTASRYHQMLMANGGLRTAQILIDADAVSDDHARLWKFNRLDLAVEAILLRPVFSHLFTEDQLRRARARFEDYGYLPRKSRRIVDREFDVNALAVDRDASLGQE